MSLERLGDFGVSSAVDTQFRTGLAVERVQRALGRRVGGITSFLETLGFIGTMFTIVLSVFIITIVLLLRLFQAIRRAFSSLRDIG